LILKGLHFCAGFVYHRRSAKFCLLAWHWPNYEYFIDEHIVVQSQRWNIT